ncbi:Protein of unknown function [Gryllus bimaculatus]|nr:Protein of unknown function [Gryllus bimaculatus]
MASCLRTVSSKLNPINQAVSRRKHATLSRLEGRLRMHMLKSQFLEEIQEYAEPMLNTVHWQFRIFRLVHGQAVIVPP